MPSSSGGRRAIGDIDLNVEPTEELMIGKLSRSQSSKHVNPLSHINAHTEILNMTIQVWIMVLGFQLLMKMLQMLKRMHIGMMCLMINGERYLKLC